jgi:hypothetical protein
MLNFSYGGTGRIEVKVVGRILAAGHERPKHSSSENLLVNFINFF